MKPTLHLVGIFHTKHQASFSHCAFTGKALRFPKMMQLYDYEVVEYSNEGSESTADEKVVMLTREEYDSFYGERKSTDFYGNDAVIGSDGHRLFEAKLIPALRQRLKPQDIICHPFGHAHQVLMSEFPSHQHVETGIGYSVLMPDSFRIFESYAWMHNHQARENRSGRNYEWVVPNYYELEDWEPNYEPGQYLAFLGRIDKVKGLDTIRAVADYSPYPIVLHGQGDPEPWSHPNIEYRGPIHGRERSEFLRNARALLAPSMFIEPFCGMSVEAMLCGTPVISVDYGAMTETVIEGVSGYRCHTLQDWIDGVHAVGDLDRRTIASIARSRWSLEACGRLYDKIFRQLNDLYRRGWYEVDQINYYEIEREEGPFAKRLIEWVAENISPRNAIDIGCGPGIYVDEMVRSGIDAIGYDTDERVGDRPNLVRKDLFDVTDIAEFVLCLEVAEHIPSEFNNQLVKKISEMIDPGGTLIWSAAHPGQGGVGHINCQTKKYWAEKFELCGLVRDTGTEESMITTISDGYHMGWFRMNGMVFRKKK